MDRVWNKTEGCGNWCLIANLLETYYIYAFARTSKSKYQKSYGSEKVIIID